MIGSYLDCVLICHHLQTHQAGDFVEGVTAKLIEKGTRPVKWNPETLLEVDQKLVKRLLDSDGSLPKGFQLDETRGRPHSGWYGLPRESYIQNLVNSKPIDKKELIEKIELEFKSKHGVREKVEEVIERKTKTMDEKLVWRRDE